MNVPFWSLPVGSRFTIPHLETVFMKVTPRVGEGDRPNFPHMPFKGPYNSIGANGSRWVWEPSRVVTVKHVPVEDWEPPETFWEIDRRMSMHLDRQCTSR